MFSKFYYKDRFFLRKCKKSKQNPINNHFTKSDFQKKIKKTIHILGLEDFAPNQNLRIALFHADGTTESFEVKHTYNQQQIEWYRSGSALNKIRKDLGVTV
jgi:aconitate hydratase